MFQHQFSNLNNTLSPLGTIPLISVIFAINNKRFITAFRITTSVAAIKKNLADVLGVEEHLFHLETDNVGMKDTSTLEELGANPDSLFIFKIIPEYNEENNVFAKVEENIPTSDVITVHLREGECQKDIVVEITKQCPIKEWMGGYLNRSRNTEYHNAVAQTDPRSNAGRIIPLMFHRDTQTLLKPVDVITNTLYNRGTQTYRSDLFISPANDQVIKAGVYNPCYVAYKFDVMVQSVVIIQRNVRKWIKAKRLERLKKFNETVMAEIQRQKRVILADEARKEREIITSAVFPVKRDDFYMLYLMVGNWWREEWKKICRFSEASKKSQSMGLLQKETKLLEEIEKQRIVGKKEALKKANVRFLNQTSSPLKFKNSKGKMIYIDDIATQKAREFKIIYSQLIQKSTIPNRIDLLITIKQLFLSYFMDYEYAEDLINLLDREMHLLSIGTKFKNLRGLQKRSEQLYMFFLKQKEFNPKSIKYTEPNTPKKMHTLFQCTRCLKLLPASMYPVHVRMKVYNICTSCTWLKNIGCNRVDMSPFVKLLNAIRDSEMERCCYQAVCFILQPIGMSYLTNVIWQGHSAISECSDLTKLQHVRWLSHLEWSPWNTILLTNQEAKCHKNIQEVFQFYHKLFIEKIKQKHILARTRFMPLLEMNHDLCSTGEWTNVTDTEI